MRHPFTLKQRPDSPYWCADGYIAGKRWRYTTSHRKDLDAAEAHREAAAEYLAECARRGAAPAGVELETDTLTLVAKYLDGPVAARARKRNPRYAAQIEADLADYVTARFTLLSQLTPRAWGEWMEECHERIKLRSVQRITSSANGFLDYCVSLGLLAARPTLPYPSREEVAPEEADRRALTAEERDRLLAELLKLDRRAWRIYTVLLYTGLRKSGLERMQLRWIDRQGGNVTFPARALKDKRPRVFWLRPEAMAAVEEELAEVGNISPDRPVFGPFDYDGRGMRGGLFWLAVKAAKIDPHGLTAHHVTRHTACTIAGLQGASLAELMAMGGWSSPQMAMRYMHVDAAAARRAVERL